MAAGNKSLMKRRVLIAVGLISVIVALASFNPGGIRGLGVTTPAATDHDFGFDPQAGETRAQITTSHGTTQLRSGEKVQPRLPPGFTAYPDAQVVDVTQVTRGDGLTVLLTMASADEPAAIAQFYHQQATDAGVTIDVAIAAPDGNTLSGVGPDGLRFSLYARPEGEGSRAQLSLSRGLE